MTQAICRLNRIRFWLQLAGTRYNPASRVLKLACQRHRHREDNRRQAMHWVINMVEAAHLKHPSDSWEHRKSAQQQFYQETMAQP